jgi:uncharacterized protein
VGEGIRFECQQTGCCCVQHDGYAYVWLIESDIPRLAKHFLLTNQEFIDKYCIEDRGQLRLNPSGTCQFLKGKRCSVHLARPAQCRSWPFGEMVSEKRWDAVQKFCPGIGKGRQYSEDEIVDILVNGKEV